MAITWIRSLWTGHYDIPRPQEQKTLNDLLMTVYKTQGFLSRSDACFLECLYGLYHDYPHQIEDIAYILRLLHGFQHRPLMRAITQHPDITFEWFLQSFIHKHGTFYSLPIQKHHPFLAKVIKRCANHAAIEVAEIDNNSQRTLKEWVKKGQLERVWISKSEKVRLWGHLVAHAEWEGKDREMWSDFVRYGGQRWRPMFEKEQLNDDDCQAILRSESFITTTRINHDLQHWIVIDNILATDPIDWSWSPQHIRERLLKNVMDLYAWAEQQEAPEMQTWAKGEKEMLHLYIHACLKHWQVYAPSIYHHPKMIEYRSRPIRSFELHPKHTAIFWSEAMDSWWKDKLPEVQDLDGLSDTVIVKMFDWFMSQGQEWPLFQNYEHQDKEKWWLCYAVTGSMVDAYEMVNKGEEPIIDEGSIYL